MTVLSTSIPDEEAEAPAERSPRRQKHLTGRALAGRIVVAAVVGAGVALRLWSSSALWLDEAISVDIARLPVDQIGAALRQDGHPPLYYLVLHGWTALFGTSDLGVRSLSAVISIACLPLMWVVGKRFGGRTTASVALLLLATSPFAIRYATEARMYALSTLLALAGYLVFVRALEAPRMARLALVAGLTAATLYTHYWGIWLVGTALALVGVMGYRRPDRRAACTRVGAALVLGGLTFAPWLPSLLSQANHTGTPWARSVEPFDATFDTLLDFGGGKWIGGRMLGPLLAALVLLALVARPLDRWRMEVDLRTVPGARPVVAMAAGTMVLGLLAAVAVSSAFQPRYAAGLFPFVLLAAAVGVGRLPNPGARWGVLAVVVLAGLAGSLRADLSQRTQARQVASVLNREATPGDVVGYCPDQLRPAVQRELGRQGAPLLQSFTYPGGSPSGRVNWVDYLDRIDAERPATFAARLLRQAGPGNTVWLVEAERYRGFGTDCEQVRSALGQARGQAAPLVNRKADSYERDVLRRYPPG